jgi:hypothetical protein
MSALLRICCSFSSTAVSLSEAGAGQAQIVVLACLLLFFLSYPQEIQMKTQKKPQLVDFVVAIVLLLGALASFLHILGFPDRARMWPLFVVAALLIFVGIHLFNLLRGLLQARVSD